MEEHKFLETRVRYKMKYKTQICRYKHLLVLLVQVCSLNVNSYTPYVVQISVLRLLRDFHTSVKSFNLCHTEPVGHF